MRKKRDDIYKMINKISYSEKINEEQGVFIKKPSILSKHHKERPLKKLSMEIIRHICWQWKVEESVASIGHRLNILKVLRDKVFGVMQMRGTH